MSLNLKAELNIDFLCLLVGSPIIKNLKNWFVQPVNCIFFMKDIFNQLTTSTTT
jgi:hypothetical protein